MAVRKLLLTASLILLPCLAAWFIFSCDPEPPEYEITGQSLELVEDGYYQNVVIAIHYETIAFTSSAPAGPSELRATSPAPPVYRNKIEGIQVTCNLDFSPNLPAGTDLVSLFHLSHYSGPHSAHEPSLTFPTDGGESRAIYLHLQQPPVSNLEPTFAVTTTLSNSLILESDLGPIAILK